MNSKRTLKISLCGLFAAFIAICSQIQIPLPYIPISLALLAIFMAGGILGPKLGTISVIVYVLLGIAGVPVFAGFRGGLSVIASPTGGYILGYIVCVLVTGLVIKYTNGNKIYMIMGMSTGLLLCYLFGTIWFMYVSEMSFKSAIIICILPFLPGDIIKIILATLISIRIRNQMTDINWR